MKLRSSLLDTYKYCKQKLGDPGISSSKLLDWLQEKDNARMNLVKLLIDSPKEIMKVDETVPSDIDIEEPEREPEPEPVKETKEMKQSRKNIERTLKAKQKK